MQCDETISHMVTAGRSYFGLQQADLISGYSRPILFRSYFGLQQADLISALGETRA